MEHRNRAAGWLTVAASLAGGGYVLRALLRALASGVSPGKLGAMHHAWDARYCVFIAGCLIGLALMGALSVLGLQWLGLAGARGK